MPILNKTSEGQNMTKPYIVCHMMMSIDGRIDCGMTSKLRGVDEYYATLDALDAPSRVSGRVTAELEMADGPWTAINPASYGKRDFSRAVDADAYEIVFDTHGSLAWGRGTDYTRPLLIVVSEQAPAEYLAYLDGQGISWIACGTDKIDAPGAVEIMGREFGIARMATVGGGNINGAFIDAGLTDEVSVLIGPGIDGRAGMAATIDGLPADREPVQLKLKHVESYDDGAVWLRYDVIK